MDTTHSPVLTDSSKLITEALVRAGADAFIGYPITPANLLYYYSSQRFPIFLAAPDEITTLQWMSGLATAGHVPVTATSFPGYALMIESINMAYMMELPMVIILVQRLGPATGTATRGAQGDIALLSGTISGGMAIPSFSISQNTDCWTLAPKAVEVAVKYRTPVVIFTSKEEVMTSYSFDISKLTPITPVHRKYFTGEGPYYPYQAGENQVPDFLPVSNNLHQVRMTASTHDKTGIIQNSSQEALQNSRRLHEKIVNNIDDFTEYDFDHQEGAGTVVITFGITSLAAREAVATARGNGKKVSLLIVKTLLPVPPVYFEIASGFKHIIVAEENITGQYRHLLFGAQPHAHITGVNEFGKMINPGRILQEINQYE